MNREEVRKRGLARRRELAMVASNLEENRAWLLVKQKVQEEINLFVQEHDSLEYGSVEAQECHQRKVHWQQCMQFINDKIQHTKREGGLE